VCDGPAVRITSSITGALTRRRRVLGDNNPATRHALPIVSKTLRHSRTGITADLYAHLTRETAHQAVDAMAAALDAAEANGPRIRSADIHRTFSADDNQ
jgi:hypothetical protein